MSEVEQQLAKLDGMIREFGGLDTKPAPDPRNNSKVIIEAEVNIGPGLKAGLAGNREILSFVLGDTVAAHLVEAHGSAGPNIIKAAIRDAQAEFDSYLFKQLRARGSSSPAITAYFKSLEPPAEVTEATAIRDDSGKLVGTLTVKHKVVQK